MLIYLIYALLVIYCLLDAYQTDLLMYMGAVELNPILSWVIGITGEVFYTIFLILLGIGIVLNERKYEKRLK